MNYIISIDSQRIYLLKKIRQYINTTTALLFKSMILSYFDIGDIFYERCKKNILKKMQTLQNNALQCVYYNRKDLTVKEMHEEAGLPFLENKRKLNGRNPQGSHHHCGRSAAPATDLPQTTHRSGPAACLRQVCGT